MFTSDNKLTKNSNVLEVKVKKYDECGYCLDTDNKVVLNIPLSVWSQWIYISQRMGNKEWGGVFWINDNTITRFKMPKQEVTSTECEFKEELGGTGIVHSHHNMGAFHSSQDDHHARNLYDYSIVLANTNGYEATKRIKLPCGGLGYVKVELRLVDCPDIDFSKITEKERKYATERSSSVQHREDLGYGLNDTPCDECSTHDCEHCHLLDITSIPCNKCNSFKCKSCDFAIAGDFREMLPFCEFCEDNSCELCMRLEQYLKNYPEDKKDFEYLYADEL